MILRYKSWHLDWTDDFNKHGKIKIFSILELFPSGPFGHESFCIDHKLKQSNYLSGEN